MHKKILITALMAIVMLCSLSAGMTERDLNEQMAQAVRTAIPEFADKEISANAFLKPYQRDYFLTLTQNTTLKISVPSKDDIARTTYAIVNVYENDNLKKTFRMKFTMQIFTDAYFAKEALEKTVTISAEMFYQKKIDILQYSNKLVHKPSELAGKIMAASVKADAPLYNWQISRKPVVVVGETIPVTFLGDGVQLQMPGKVLQQGYLGDKILVQLIRTKKTFKVLILEPGRYEVQL